MFEKIVEKINSFNETLSFDIWIVINAFIAIVIAVVLFFIIRALVRFLKAADFRSLVDPGSSLFNDYLKDREVDKILGNKKRYAMWRECKESGDKTMFVFLKMFFLPLLRIGLISGLIIFLLKYFQEPITDALMHIRIPGLIVAYMEDITILAIILVFIYPVFNILWMVIGPYFAACLLIWLFKISDAVEGSKVLEYNDVPLVLLNIAMWVGFGIAGLYLLIRIAIFLKKIPAFVKFWQLSLKGRGVADYGSIYAPEFYRLKNILEDSRLENKALRERVGELEYYDLGHPKWLTQWERELNEAKAKNISETK